MTLDELRKVEKQLEQEYRSALVEARSQYLEDNAFFKIGDFIENITGIIKVESIRGEFSNINRDPEIMYGGFPYKKVKGVLSRTKDNNMRWLRYNIDYAKYTAVSY